MTGDGDRDGPGDAVPGEREDRPELDIDAAFAAIVADFGRSPVPGVGPWPAAEDVDPDAPDTPDPDAADATGAPAGATVLPDPGRLRPLQRSPRHRLPDEGAGAADGPAGPPDDDDPSERFVPPEAPPITTNTDLASRLAWLGVLGGPLVLLLAALAWSRLPTYVVILALAAFVGGFVTLVARLPRDREDGSDDDGAVV